MLRVESSQCFIMSSYMLEMQYVFFFFKQKTAYEMRISDWSSDVCSADLAHAQDGDQRGVMRHRGSGGGRKTIVTGWHDRCNARRAESPWKTHVGADRQSGV